MTFDHDPSDADRKAVGDGLKTFNRLHCADPGSSPLEIVARDDGGRMCGGLLGETRWHWLVVNILWVAETHRGVGLGSRLLAAAEDAARARGCRAATLHTRSYQAPDFYVARGYAVHGEMSDYPPGHRTIYFSKML